MSWQKPPTLRSHSPLRIKNEIFVNLFTYILTILFICDSILSNICSVISSVSHPSASQPDVSTTTPSEIMYQGRRYTIWQNGQHHPSQNSQRTFVTTLPLPMIPTSRRMVENIGVDIYSIFLGCASSKLFQSE